MATTTLGLEYPVDTDHTRLWEWFQDLAESADAAITTASAAVVGKLIFDGTRSTPDNTFTGVMTTWTATGTGTVAAGGVTLATNGITVPVAGSYWVSVNTLWAANISGKRGAAITVNGTEPSHLERSLVQASANVSVTANGPVVLLPLAAGDKVNIIPFQSSGAALNMTSADLSVALA